jgi:superfamily II DNA/RNA helicase
MSFSSLGVAPDVCALLEKRGLVAPFPIQAATIPDGLAGRDICGKAPTGSGKTLAFGLVLAARTGKVNRPRWPQALVLVPTRELAAQVAQELALLMPRGTRDVAALYGGAGYEKQRRALLRGATVVVACPGRLEDLIARGEVHLDDVKVAVIDEADRMADMGFLPCVRRILDQTSPRRQTLLYSATLDGDVATLIKHYQTDPASHAVVNDDDDAGEVTHHFWQSAGPDRVKVTAELVQKHGRAIVFCRTRHGADRLRKQLAGEGIDSVAIHGDRSQAQRERALAAFASGKVAALVATDVAARGIHVDDVACVVHFDPPGDAKDYIHRSGRTGRAGAPGMVVSLVADKLAPAVRALQRAIGHVPADAPAPSRPPRPARSNNRQHKRASRPGGRNTMSTGTVKFFNAAKGFGFIARDGGADVFVHYSNIDGAGYRSLEIGQQVEFAVAPGRKGDEAHSVRAI